MTRQRFVKLLMSHGYDRNEANDIAAVARDRGIDYATAYVAVKSDIDLISIDLNALYNAMERIKDAVIKVANAFSKALSAFSQAYREEMEACDDL